MKVFITGATGYIGHRLAHNFASRGHIVHALVRSPQKADTLQHKNIVLFSGDVNNNRALTEASRGCDVSIHTAAFAAIYAKDPSQFEKINIAGTREVLNASQENGVKKFIFISSAGVLGPSSLGPVTELTERSIPYFNEYERTKGVAQSFVLQQNSENMPTVALNLTRVFGPGLLTEANATTRLVDKVAKQSWRIIPGNGKSVGNYVFIDDVIQACHRAIEKGRGGHNYIIGADNLSFNEFFETVKKLSGANHAMIKMPVGVIMTASRIMKLMARFGSNPAITPEWVKRYMYDWVLDNTKARTELEMEFTPFEEAIKKTLEWLKKTSQVYST